MSFTTGKLRGISLFLSFLLCCSTACHKLKVVTPPCVSYEEFHKLLRSGKPMVVEFGRKWFPPSMKTRDALTRFWIKYRDRVNVCFVEVLKNQKLADRYNIDFIPTILIFNKKGEEVFRYVGQWGEDDIVKAVTKLGLISGSGYGGKG